MVWELHNITFSIMQNSIVVLVKKILRYFMFVKLPTEFQPRLNINFTKRVFNLHNSNTYAIKINKLTNK